MKKEEYKSEAIKYAWSIMVGDDNYAKVRHDENGWSDWRCRQLMPSSYFDNLDWKLKPYKTKEPSGNDMLYRPKMLNGIEVNNGWHRIETRLDLPKNEGMYTFMIDGREVNQYYQSDISFSKLHTHWRNIIETPKPLY